MHEETIKICFSENLQWVKFLVHHCDPAHFLEIVLVHSRYTGSFHKHMYDGFPSLDGGHSKFFRMVADGIDESSQLKKVMYCLPNLHQTKFPNNICSYRGREGNTSGYLRFKVVFVLDKYGIEILDMFSFVIYSLILAFFPNCICISLLSHYQPCL